MKIQTLKLMLVMLGLFAIPWIPLLLFRSATAAFLQLHPWLALFGSAAFLSGVLLAMYVAQDQLMTLPPQAGSSPVSRSTLITSLNDAFALQAGGGPVFTVHEKGDILAISWAAELKSNQLLHLAKMERKMIFFLTFDEARNRVTVSNMISEWDWGLSPSHFSLHGGFQIGFVAETSVDYRPSFDFDGGKLRFDIKKLTFNTGDIWEPIKAVVTNSGWSILCGGWEIPGSPRFRYGISLALLLYLLSAGGFFIWSMEDGQRLIAEIERKAANLPAPPKLPAPPLVAAEDDSLQAQLKKMASEMPLTSLKQALENLLAYDLRTLPESVRATFRTYATAYLNRAADDQAFDARLRARLEILKK